MEEGSLYKVHKDSLEELIPKVGNGPNSKTKEYKHLPVAILCIMGPSRSGKSFFLYFVIRYLEQLTRIVK